jgi:hypothetical protein
MKAVELIQKLVTRRYTGKKTVEVVLRFAKGSVTLKNVRDYIEPHYGEALKYEVIESGDPDKLGKLIRPEETAVRCTFDLDSAITHIMALPPWTQIRT